MLEPDSKQVNALINQIIIDGDELRGIETGRCAGERREGGFPLGRGWSGLPEEAAGPQKSAGSSQAKGSEDSKA